MQHQHNSTPIKISKIENILKHVKISLLYFRTARGMVKCSFCIYFGLFPFPLENCSNFYVCHMRAMIQILQMKLWFQWLVSSVHSYWEIERGNLKYSEVGGVLSVQNRNSAIPLVCFRVYSLIIQTTDCCIPKPDCTFWVTGQPDLLLWKQISAKSWKKPFTCVTIILVTANLSMELNLKILCSYNNSTVLMLRDRSS